MKTSSLSVRVDDDDAAFLAELEIDGARTASEKLRALLRAERRRQEGVGDALEAMNMVRDLLQPARRRLKRMEAETAMKSEFLAKLYDRVAEIAGAAFVGPDEAENDAARKLTAFENEMLDDIFAFIQEMIGLGLTTRNRCYDPAGIEKRLASVLEILELINMSKELRQKGVE